MAASSTSTTNIEGWTCTSSLFPSSVAIAIGINTWSCGCFVSRGDRYELARRRKKKKKRREKENERKANPGCSELNSSWRRVATRVRFLPTNVLQPTPAEGGVAQVGTADDVVFKILFKLLRRREASETQAHQIPATGGRRSKWDDKVRGQTRQNNKEGTHKFGFPLVCLHSWQ